MRNIKLAGQLICHNNAEAALVEKHLARHIELTRAEPGCLSFEVVLTEDPLVWNVAERFQDAASFRFHQARATASAWGRATAAIKRSYTVTGLYRTDSKSPVEK
ncbi:antibiotic biosynthesis monooxygenase [Arthrobacter sp. MYb227]|uniref:putative quinol monooxygenase n=1 Tax=Arthrobacter sp. MYb227 TaxID=1848601 RepID=UPI000CFC9A0B|nr:antibiotic biosynthesis monooxygenase [Arthrobacter sp. MYb227]PQZ93749.1 antibiotic biosynthesis monooxygenase [Arthrobacter sp. MYb227]